MSLRLRFWVWVANTALRRLHDDGLLCDFNGHDWNEVEVTADGWSNVSNYKECRRCGERRISTPMSSTTTTFDAGTLTYTRGGE